MTSKITQEPFVASKTSKRIFYLDVLRVIACLCVIMVHTSACFTTYDIGSFDFYTGNLFDSLSRIGVPLFVMISGALFLDEAYEFTIKKMISHIWKIVCFFLFWSTFYSLLNNLLLPAINHKTVSWKMILASIINGPIHLWFCFMIVGLYLIVPLLKLWVKKENKTQVGYFVALAFIFSMFIPNALSFFSMLFPVFNNLEPILNNMNLFYTGGYTTYFILGWYLNNFEIKHKKAIIVLGCMGIFVSFAGTAILSVTFNKFYSTYSILSTHVAFQAIMVFMLIKNKCKDTADSKSFIHKAITFTGKYSLGIYAIHMFFINFLSSLLTKAGILSLIVRIPLIFLSTFFISLFASFILSKIPFIKKIVV